MKLVISDAHEGIKAAVSKVLHGRNQAAHRSRGHLPERSRLTGLRLEQNDECTVQRCRYMTLETIAPLSDDPFVSLPAAAA